MPMKNGILTTVLQWRKLNLEAKIESSQSCPSFKCQNQALSKSGM